MAIDLRKKENPAMIAETIADVPFPAIAENNDYFWSEKNIDQDLKESRRMLHAKNMFGKYAKIAKDIRDLSEFTNNSADDICRTILVNFCDFNEIENLKKSIAEMKSNLDYRIVNVYDQIKKTIKSI